VDQGNSDIKKKLKDLREEALQGPVNSVPSTIEEEFKINPFMRLDVDAIKQSTNQTDSVSVMQALRDMKNNFTK
jgi:hypothetical protein